MPSHPQEPYPKWRNRAGRLLRGSSAQEAAPAAPEADASQRPGHMPDVEVETTNLGPVMDEAVVRAKRRMRIGADPDYDLLYENFDVLHYLLQSPDLIDRPDVDLIEHFLENGRAEGLSPHPDFSMTEYVDRYPRKTAPQNARDPFLFWLKHGKAAGDIADPAPRINRVAPVLGLPPEQVADLVADRRRDLQQRFRTGRLGEVFAKAAEIEPLIGDTWTEIADPHLIPLSRRVVVDEICAIYQAHEAAGFRRARVVLLTSQTQPDGERRMDDHFAQALAAHIDPDDLVVISTDRGAEIPDSRYPDGVRRIDFGRMARDLPRNQAEHALVMLLRTFHADAIVNVESKLLYEALRTYARALVATERLFLYFSGNEQTAMGTWSGRSLSYFYRMYGDVAGVIVESDDLARALTETFRVGEKDRARLHVFQPPDDPTSEKAFAAQVTDLLLASDGPREGGR